MRNSITRKLDLTLGVLWTAICGYFFSTLFQNLCEVRPDRLDTICLSLCFVFLYAAGFFASFYLLIGARWGRIIVGIVALLTVTASVMGLFAFFNSDPFSFVGVLFDLFAIVSAGVLLLSRQHAPA